LDFQMVIKLLIYVENGATALQILYILAIMIYET